MAQVNLYYTIKATNTGVQHDLICGCSILNPSTGAEVLNLPWWRIFNVATGVWWRVPLPYTSFLLTPGTYLAKARAWQNFSGGEKVGDLTYEGNIIGAIYMEGALTGILDEATQTIVVSGAGVSADITEFTITVS